jgi:hypothetical protein
MELSCWIKDVRSEYERLGKRKQGRIAKKTTENKEKKMEFFSPRRRLTFSMKNVAVKFLFANKYITNVTNDFIPNRTTKEPIDSRTIWSGVLDLRHLS